MYSWAAKPTERNLTVADLRAGKGKKKFTQVTANTADEATAAAEAGIDLIIGNSQNVEAVWSGNDTLFLTAAIGLPNFPTETDILREAFRALELGADAITAARSMDVATMLAKADIPVMGHLGLVPRKSTWVGGLRAIGKMADEAFQLHQRFRRLEDAGAFAVEAEVIPGPAGRSAKGVNRSADRWAHKRTLHQRPEPGSRHAIRSYMRELNSPGILSGPISAAQHTYESSKKTISLQ